MIGQTISHYRITAKLGEGGMGEVYRAEDVQLHRKVALKFLPAELTRDPDAKARFIQEARAASALDHPNVCTIYETGETDDGRLFITMACYEGETLKERIARGPLPLAEAVDIARQIGEGLAKAHEQGIVHRDIKPANIFVTTDGLVKILDFGVAKLKGQVQLTRTGTTLGTAAYMSPEQARGDEVDRRTDIWSLGVVLYEMIAGRPPFKGEHEQAVIYAIMNEEPESVTGLRSGVPLELDRMAGKALAKREDERYQHLDDLLADLRSLKRELDSEAAAHSASGKRRTGFKALLPWIIGAIVVIDVAVVGINHFSSDVEAIDSVAVLPFESSSGSTTDEYIVDGIMGDLISNLSKIGELKVTARAVAMRYKDSDKTLKQIADELGVQTVIAGDVRLVGEKIKVYVELIQAESERSLWSENYDQDLREIETLFNDISLNVVRLAEIELTPEEKTRFASSREVDPRAYEKFLEARSHYYEGAEEGGWKALALFREAIEIDPLYARAYAWIALIHIYLGGNGHETPQEAATKGMAAAMKALELDDTQAETYAALGWIKFVFGWDYRGAEPYLRRAVELKPNDMDMILFLSSYLRITGRFDEAIELIETEIELAPRVPEFSIELANCYINAGMYDESIAQLKKSIDRYPESPWSHMGLAFNYIEKGMSAEAIAALDRASILAGDSEDPTWLMYSANIYARSGLRDRALEILERFLALSEVDNISPYTVAFIYLGLEDREKVFEWLERGYEERDPAMIVMDTDFNSLRDDPRYQDLLRRIGIPADQGKF